MNRVLTWVVILLLVIGQGFTAYKLTQLQNSIVGLTVLVMTTNQEASSLLKKLLPLSTLKDEGVRNRLIKREITNRNSNLEELFGNRAQVS